MKRKLKFFGIASIVVLAAMGFYLWGQHAGQTGTGIEIVKKAEAAGGKVTSPDGTAPDRYMYYPGTEALGKDEIRLIALGTGMPLARRSQAATCWLVEVGNGDKFLFDIGTGANANLSSLMIPFDFLRKVFLTHMVFNVTKENIKIRMTVIDEDIWPQPAVGKKLPPDASKRIRFSEFITGGRVNYKEVVDKIFSDINKKYGTNIPAPQL